MNKIDYFRKIIFIGNDVKELLKIIPNWLYTEEKYDGLNRVALTNKTNSVKIIFHNDCGYYQSVNVLPIEGVKSYDFNETQETDFQKDILFTLWLKINQVIFDNRMNIQCGFIPSVYDCGAQSYNKEMNI